MVVVLGAAVLAQLLQWLQPLQPLAARKSTRQLQLQLQLLRSHPHPLPLQQRSCLPPLLPSFARVQPWGGGGAARALHLLQLLHSPRRQAFAKFLALCREENEGG